MRRIVATLCWLASFFPAILTAQALPGYERTMTDQIRNNDSRKLAKLAESEIEGLRSLDLAAWKDRAICWGRIDYEGEKVRIEFGEAACFRLQRVKLKRAKVDVVAGEPVMLPKPKKVKKLLFTLPEGGQAELETQGKGQELFGIFRLNSTQAWACLGRQDSSSPDK